MLYFHYQETISGTLTAIMSRKEFDFMLTDSAKSAIAKPNAVKPELIPQSRFVHPNWSLNHLWAEWKWKITTIFPIHKLKVVQDCAVNRRHPLLWSFFPPLFFFFFHHYSDCGVFVAERGAMWWSMTAVTIQTTERLGEKCNFPSSVELQKRGWGGGWRKNLAELFACNY